MKVKVCGLRTSRDVEVCVEAGADMLGFLVADVDSPRAITPQETADLIDATGGVETVAVDTSRDPDDALKKLDMTGADRLQMHRDDLDGRELSDLAGSCDLIQVVKVCEEGLPDIRVEGDFVLLDTTAEVHGGTGETHDWDASHRLVEECPVPVILAGGLGPDNVAEAVSAVRPSGVDAASRLDGGKGKDPEAVRRFVKNAKGA
ncbi:MAG: N-(5'-phosphoribosyl)anthranilate isomerase [Methanonatronarchaeales archaeon]|nr:N-(5'-phosphoribosyl)anthranilate isomerase [Methanonatronarchaeales archaeon]